MVGFGEAIAHGAATIINAISIGKGAAFGVDLWTKAKVQLTDAPDIIKGEILSDPHEDQSLIKEAVTLVLKHFNLDRKVGATVITDSNIPIAKGLKSSSVAANALVLATIGALGKKLDDETILKLSVEAAINAKITVTGAFDDACASFYGNIVVTDNYFRKVLKFSRIPQDLTILFYIPQMKSYTIASDVDRMKLMTPFVEMAFNEALKGNHWIALTLNGLLYAAALGYDSTPAIDSLEAGAIASGLSGKGPAIVAVVEEKNVDKIIDVWTSSKVKIIKAKINRRKARITRRE